MRLMTAASTLLGATLAVISVTQAANISDCTNISSNSERLACYDLASGRTATSATHGPGNWDLRSSINPLDDSTTTIALLFENAERKGFGEKRGSLIIRCRSNETDVYISWGKYLGNDSGSIYEETKNITLRLDNQKATTTSWDVSTDNEATFAPKAIPLAREIATASRMVAQTIPFGESPRTLEFDLTGAADAVKGVAETCNWKLETK